MIIQGHLASASIYPLFVVGSLNNDFGKYITSRYNDPKIRYAYSIYDKIELDNLRYYSSLYFHGHSVGGTNPSLIEAMACRCYIAAHNNRFNKAVLNSDATYFSSSEEVSGVIQRLRSMATAEQWKRSNIEKINTIYNQEKIVDSYEEMMLMACGEEKTVVRLPIAEAV